MDNADSIRQQLAAKYAAADFAENGTVELVGASFSADADHIFGAVNRDYVDRELDWYESMSLSVDDIPGGPPAIWSAVAGKTTREVNSNYGYLLFSRENGSQYANVVKALVKDPGSRQALAIYTRPTMHADHNRDGMRDFVCTNAVQYLIRNGTLQVVVQMRSNDAVYGYRNDYAWQRTVQRRLAVDLAYASDRPRPLPLGEIVWQVGSFHVYPRHFKLIERFIETGEHETAL